jgi:hypothetical protein
MRIKDKPHDINLEMKICGRQRSGWKKDLVLESPEKVIIFFGGFYQNSMDRKGYE